MSTESSHILTNFQKALNTTREDLLAMASRTRHNLDLSIRGLLERNPDLCAEVIADDEEIDQLEMKIDKEGMQTMMLYQPVASDLRSLVSIMKVASNLERVADQAVSIAKRARKISKSDEVPEVRLVEPIHQLAASLLHDSITSFAEKNVSLALGIRDRDDELDTAHKRLVKALTKRMEEDTVNIRVYLDLVFIVRFLERVGDHAKNIGEEAVFVASAQDIRHKSDRAKLEN
jgi:phosphate transport system protein